MKLKNLFETKESLTQDITKRILHDCTPFLHEIDYDIERAMLYRGISYSSQSKMNKLCDGVYSHFVRKNRIPMDTAVEVSSTMDKWFDKKFGVKYRSQALFCAGNSYVTLNYGKPHVILPIGKFTYCWSKRFEDLYSDNTLIFNSLSSDPFEREESIFDLLESADYQTGDLKLALSKYTRHEIMLNCNEYYAIERGIYDSYFINSVEALTK